MKESTKLLVVVILSLIWALTTIFAAANNSMIMEDSINIFMLLVPFISFFGSLLIYHFEYKFEQKIN